MAKILDIKTHPKDKNLKQFSKEIKLDKELTKEMLDLIEDMKLTMKEKDGVGLAAPQIGKNIRLIVINTKDDDICLINPEITKKSWAKEIGEEGCLSLPGIFCEVKRHKKITCVYYDQKGKKTILPASGLLARAIQHEVDHLDGILILDRKQK